MLKVIMNLYINENGFEFLNPENRTKENQRGNYGDWQIFSHLLRIVRKQTRNFTVPSW